jgi:flagellar biosynthetic protein FliP
VRRWRCWQQLLGADPDAAVLCGTVLSAGDAAADDRLHAHRYRAEPAQALGTQAAPPNQIIVGLSMFLTLFVMGPTLDKVYADAYQPYAARQISVEEALARAETPMRQFMLRQTRQADVALFTRLARLDGTPKPETLPLRVLVPAFVTSELKSAFQIGFLVFIPFLVIDMVVASVLMSLGMVMLSPVLVSVFQAATQLHEATLSFVPKVLAGVAVLMVAGPWMLTTLVECLQRVLQAILGAVG